MEEETGYRIGGGEMGTEVCRGDSAPGCIYFGEVSLSGAIRPVGQMAARLKEAEKLGFTAAAVPDRLDRDTKDTALQLDRISHLSALTGQLVSADAVPDQRMQAEDSYEGLTER
jgi:DNA repair protein RadA/Sms